MGFLCKWRFLLWAQSPQDLRTYSIIVLMKCELNKGEASSDSIFLHDRCENFMSNSWLKGRLKTVATWRLVVLKIYLLCMYIYTYIYLEIAEIIPDGPCCSMTIREFVLRCWTFDHDPGCFGVAALDVYSLSRTKLGNDKWGKIFA